MSGTIRLALPGDAADLHAIYAPIVLDTIISFELEPPTVAEMQQRVEKTFDAGLPWLVHEENGEVSGYVYAAKHRGERPAYRWSTEVSVYIHERARGRGIGTALYTSLFAVLKLQQLRNAYAGATLPNEGSVRLHEALGFERVGVYHNVGYKFGAWHDVVWWSLQLNPHSSPPSEIINIDHARSTAAWTQALHAGVQLLR